VVEGLRGEIVTQQMVLSVWADAPASAVIPQNLCQYDWNLFNKLIYNNNIKLIKKRIDEERLGGKYGDEGKYYRDIRNRIKKSIDREAKSIVIEIIPKRPIEEVWIVECLLDLQSEFTKILLIPECTMEMPEQDIFEIKNFLHAEIIIKRTTRHTMIIFA
jgi:hypothetical protein